MKRLMNWIIKMFKKEDNRIFQGFFNGDGTTWHEISQEEFDRLNTPAEPDPITVGFLLGLQSILDAKQAMIAEAIATYEGSDRGFARLLADLQ